MTSSLYTLFLALLCFAQGCAGFTVADMCNCAAKVEPVCGVVQGKPRTFMNRCVLNCTKLNSPGANVTIDYEGVCCPLHECQPYQRPVCDRDGMMYKNECAFRHARCVAERKKLRPLVKDMRHPNCRCSRECPQSPETICDTEGMEHFNFCAFYNWQCLSATLYNRTREIDYVGRCCENNCDTHADGLAVCDSNHNSHPSLCAFLHTHCVITKREGPEFAPKFKFLGMCDDASRRQPAFASLFPAAT